jgi:hypothetical protein
MRRGRDVGRGETEARGVEMLIWASRNRKLEKSTFLVNAFKFTGRAQNSPPPCTPHRERASGEALALIRHLPTGW